MSDQVESAASDSEFVIKTILSSVKPNGDDSNQDRTNDVISKLVTFYEDRLNRQKNEMKDEFMRLLSSTKVPSADSEVQCEPHSGKQCDQEVKIDQHETSAPNNQSPGLANGISQQTPPITSPTEDDVIEVDIRPPQSSNTFPILQLGGMPSPEKEAESNESPDKTSANQPPLGVNPVLMMMMNILGGGNSAEEIMQRNTEHDPEVKLVNSENITPQPAENVESDEIPDEKDMKNEDKSDSEGLRPPSGVSFSTDYDPANPSFLKPPSPRIAKSPQFTQHISVSHQVNGENCDYSASPSSSSIRVQLHEKHQKQISDLKAYYEEELDELREKLRRTEERHFNSNYYSSKYTNTTPSPKKSGVGFSSANNTVELERECASLRLKVEWLDQAYKNTTQRLKDSESQVDELATKLSAYTLRVADAGGEIEDLRQEYHQKDEEIDRLMARNSRLLVEVDESGRMLHIKDQSLSESDAMLNRLMREYQSMNKDYEALKYKHEACDNIISDAKQELASVKRQMNKMSFEFKRLEHENDLLTKRLQLTTSFSVAERFSTPQPKAQPTQVMRSPREHNRNIAPAGLSSLEAHGSENKYRGNSKVSFGPPYALCSDESSDSTDVDKDVTQRMVDTTPQKVYKEQGIQAASSAEESVMLKAERELFGQKSRQRADSDQPNKPSPRKMAVSISTDFNKPSPSKRTTQHLQSNGHGNPSNMEQQFDRLLIEKQKVEASLNRLPAMPHNQTIRANKELLERQLDDIERRLASIRFALKKSHVIRSSMN